MKKYPKNYHASPNEWIPHNEKMEWQCCDCGLVHNVESRLFDGLKPKSITDAGFLLQVRMTRNTKETKRARAKRPNPPHI